MTKQQQQLAENCNLLETEQQSGRKDGAESLPDHINPVTGRRFIME